MIRTNVFFFFVFLLLPCDEQSGVEKPTIGPSVAETTTFDEQCHSIERAARHGQGTAEDGCCCGSDVDATADIRLTPTFVLVCSRSPLRFCRNSTSTKHTPVKKSKRWNTHCRPTKRNAT